jgi:hypothetical protein
MGCSRWIQVERQKGQHFIITFLSRGANSTTCITIVIANRTACINAMMRPKINNSFVDNNLPNIVHLARVIRLLLEAHLR